MRVSTLAKPAAALVAAAAAFLAACPAASAADPALERARALFRPSATHGRGAVVTERDPRGATIVLRDLRAALPRMSGRDRAEAVRLLARPADESSPYEPGWGTGPDLRICDVHVCIHWTTEGKDAPPLADADGSGFPDWVETNLKIFAEVWAKEIGGLHYKPPRSDVTSPTNGGDGRLDVYLADVGAQGYFGWCTSDDPAVFTTRRVSAYCVIDDDYKNPKFNTPSPLAALRVTAAHEFFHTVQFGYDWLEDLWLMEGTAVWIEDEVYDGVNDNLRYLRSDSPIMRPGIPLDRGRGGYEYGAWIFWRYLSERFGAGIVRSVWNRAAERDTANPYSLIATRRALQGRGRSFAGVFSGFGVANRMPTRGYREGGRYPDGPSGTAVRLGSDRPGTGERSLVLRHLSNRAIVFRPTGGSTALRVSVAASKRRAAAATLIVRRRSGRVTVRRVRLGRSGAGAAVVPFERGEIRSVELLLTNASTDFACWKGSALSCAGIARDDRLRFVFEAQISR